VRALTALFCISAFLLVLPAHIQAQAPGNTELTQEEAYYLGRTVAANILEAYKPYTANEELTQYVNRICQTLVINSSQPIAYNGYHVMVLDTLEFNAFATSGGHIFITRGLARAGTSEDMLAAVIAHELAHITLKHNVAAVKITAENSANPEFFRETVTKSLDTLMKTGYSQSQEFSADSEAMMILASAGYDPMALVDLLKILQKIQMTRTGGFNTTHPSPQARIANLEQLRYRVPDTRKSRAPRYKKMQF